MGLKFHPTQGSIVHVAFNDAFIPPEMVKPRLCVVVSKPMKARPGLCTVVPLSTTTPDPVMPYHCEIDIPFMLPARWAKKTRWLKGDMIYSAGFHRMNLLLLEKDRTGKRRYQTSALPDDVLKRVQRCILHGLALSELTKQL